MKKLKSYKELSQLKSHEDRLNYLRLDGVVAERTFGADRYINQSLYHSAEWKKARRDAILRDNGCDLGIEGYEINDKIMVHHINPISLEDIENSDPCVFDLDNLITVTRRTHDTIHYGIAEKKNYPKLVLERTPNDTCPWKQ